MCYAFQMNDLLFIKIISLLLQLNDIQAANCRHPPSRLPPSSAYTHPPLLFRTPLLFLSLSASLHLIHSPFSSLILAVFPPSSPATHTGRAVQSFLRCFKLLYKTAAQPDSAYCTTSSMAVCSCVQQLI